MTDQRDYKIKKYRYKLMMAPDSSAAAIYQRKLNQYLGQAGGATEAELKAARDKLTAAQTAVSSAAPPAINVKAVKDNFDALVARAHELKVALEESRKEAAEKQTALEAAQAKVVSLTAQLEETRADKDASESDLRSQLLTETERVTELKAELTAKTSRVAELEAKLEGVRTELIAANEKIGSLEDDLVNAASTAESLQNQITAMSESRTEGQAALDKLAEDLGSVLGDLDIES